MGCSNIAVIAPPEFLPNDIETWPVTCYATITEGLVNADVIVTLRIQLERIILPPSTPEPAQFFEKFRLTNENLQLAHPQAIVMHPAPMNRENRNYLRSSRRAAIRYLSTNHQWRCNAHGSY